MNEQHGERHVHAGMSSRGVLDASAILKEAGLKKGDAFLDAGCGDGFISIEAVGIVGPAGKVHAVDIDSRSILKLKAEITKKGIGNIEAVASDITKRIPVSEGSIDVCLMSNVLHGFVENGEAGAVLGEIFRALKSGAIFTVVEFKKKRGLFGPPLRVKLAPEDVETAVRPLGFSRTRIADAGRHHYQITFVKK